MKKLLLFLMLGIFMISFTSAFPWQKTLVYDKATQTVGIYSSDIFTPNDLEAVIKLNTPIRNRVRIGKDTKVAEFNLSNFDYLYGTAFEDMNFYQINSGMKEFTRDFDYKYLAYENDTRPIYGSVCEMKMVNGTDQEICIIEELYEEDYTKEIWIKFSDVNELPIQDVVTVGIFTDTLEGDYVEWIPTLFGKELDMFAIWESSLDVELANYYKFDEEDLTGSGTITDEQGNQSCTNNGADNSTGIIKTAYNYIDTGSDYINCSSWTYGVDGTFSFSLWFNPNTLNFSQFLVSDRLTGDNTNFNLELNGSNALRVVIEEGAGNINLLLTSSNIISSVGEWHHIAVTFDSTNNNLTIWVNGSNVASNLFSFQPPKVAADSNFGRLGGGVDVGYINGSIDEAGRWTRVLTISEIILLSEAPPFRAIVNVTVSLLSPTDNALLNESTVNFSASVTTGVGKNLTNATVFIWDINNSLFKENTQVLLGNETTIAAFNIGGLVDGNYTWNIEGCDNSSNCAFAPSNRTVSIDTTGPIIIILKPEVEEDYGRVNLNTSLNYSIVDNNLESCWYNYNGTNVTTPCLTNSSFIQELDNNNITIYANDSLGNLGVKFKNWDYKILEISQTFINSTLEGNIQNISALIKLKSGETISSVILNYNGSLSVGTTESLGDNLIIARNGFVTPNVNSDQNISFNWSIVLSAGDIINLSNQNQTIQNIGIDNCSTLTNKILSMTVVDEETQIKTTNGTILEIALDIISSDGSALVVNFSNQFEEINPVEICLNLNLSGSESYSLNAIIRYTSTGRVNEYYNLVDLTLDKNSVTQNLTLFDLNSSDSTDFQLTFIGEDFLPVENALVLLERQYIAENTFKTVELPKTDANGQTVLHLVRNDVIYNILIMKDGEVLGNFANVIAFCQDFTIGDCSLPLNALTNTSLVFNYDEVIGLIFEESPQYNDTTKTISFAFISEDGTPKLVKISVERRDIFGNRTVCENTVLSASGTISCTITQDLDDTSLFTVISVDGEDKVFSNVIIDSSGYGQNGYAMFFIFALAMSLLFSGSKTWTLIGISLNYIIGVSLGFIIGGVAGAGTTGIFVLIITLTGIWQLNKGRKQ